MTQTLGFQIASAYRALAPGQKAFVDDLMTKAEDGAAIRKITVQEVLEGLRIDSLPDREQMLLTSPLVKAAISERRTEIDNRNALTEYKILRTDQIIMEASIADFMSEDLKEIDLSTATPEKLLAVESFEIEEKPNGTRKYKLKLYSKHPSLQRLTEIAKMRGGDSAFWAEYRRGHARKTALEPVGADQAAQEKKWIEIMDKIK